MPSITPSLWFDNNLAEAAEFYTSSIFPNSRIETFERYTEQDPVRPVTWCRGPSCSTAPGSSA